jgi:hypothetical protein
MPSFPTPGPIAANVDIVLGDIRFSVGDRTDSTVEVRPADPSSGLDAKAAEEVDIECADGRLRVTHPKLRTMFTRKYGTVTVVVELPTGSDVEGATAKGDLLVEGAVGSCALKTTTGNIRVGQASDVRLRTSGGTVTAEGVSGKADITGNGEIHLSRVGGEAVVKNIGGGDIRVGEVAGELRVNATLGHLSVDAARAGVVAKAGTGDIRVGRIGGPVDVSTATGEVDLGVPEDTPVRVDAHTSIGRVHNRLSAPEPSARTVAVRARSHGGDITVHHA